MEARIVGWGGAVKVLATRSHSRHMACAREVVVLKADLIGQVQQTKLPRWKPLLPLFEAVMNSYHSIRETGDSRSKTINILLHRSDELFDNDNALINGFTVYDDGAGFHDESLDSFNTVSSQRKSQIGGKGVGRLLYLKAFDEAKIASVFESDEFKSGFARRDFAFNLDYDPDQVPAPVEMARVPKASTTVSLLGYREPYASQAPRDLEQIAHKLCEHFILILIDQECPQISLIDGNDRISLRSFFAEHYRSTASHSSVEIKGTNFEFLGFKLKQGRSTKSRIAYSADERVVLWEKLESYIPNFAHRLVDEDGEPFSYLAVVRSTYLNDRVNPARTTFDLHEDDDAEMDQSSLLADEIRKSDIRNACLEFVQNDLSDVLDAINAEKISRIEKYVLSNAPHYRILLPEIQSFIDRMPPSGGHADLEAALHRELHKKEVALKKTGRKIIAAAAKLDDYEGYKEQLESFLADYNKLGVAALAQYVAHRKIILNLFKKALSADAKSGKYPLEKVVHNIIFPMQSANDEILFSQQNLWILDEKLNYHDFAYSDKALSRIEQLGVKDKMRPDLLLFDREIPLSESKGPLTSLTIVEFKRPERDDYTGTDNPISQVAELVERVRTGRAKDGEGRTIDVASPDIPTNCMIVCDITPSLERELKKWDATKTPDKQGFYGYNRAYNFYFEVYSYNKILRDAERRNQAFFDRLNLL
jgi:hypothetical protein